MNFNLDDLKKQELILKFISFFWIVSKVISYKVWISDRFFPVIPVFNFTTNFPNSIHFLLFVISLSLLLFIVIFQINKRIASIFLLVEIGSCLLDQMRWQPWEYFYLLLFLFFVISKNQKQFMQLVTILIVTTYFFSGLNKLNGGFLTFLWKHMVLIKMFKIPKTIIDTNLWIYYLGIVLALIEISFAFALLFLKNKKVLVVLICTMHLFILILLGLIFNFNPVVWPWNISMIGLILIIFYKNKNRIFSKAFIDIRQNYIVFILLFTTCLLGKFGFWYSQFAFHLYDGNSNKLIVYAYNLDKYPNLKGSIQTKKSTNGASFYTLDLSKYALKELEVTLNPDDYTYSNLKIAWQKKYPESKGHFIKLLYPYKNENKIEIK
jgi:hypothetical protein